MTLNTYKLSLLAHGGGEVGLLAVLKGKVVEKEKPGGKREELAVNSLEDHLLEDPISLLRRKVLCALEYTGNYQEVLLENGKVADVEKMEKFARDRVRDALVHAGFIVPPSEVAGSTWGDACFDAIGLNSKYLILGEVKWGDGLTMSEIEAFLGRVEEAAKRGRGREIVFFVASLNDLGGKIREVFNNHPNKNFIVSFEEVRPYSF